MKRHRVMPRDLTLLGALVPAACLALAAGPSPAPGADVPNPAIRASFVTAAGVPASLFCAPGGGDGFAAAQAFGGGPVDATLTARIEMLDAQAGYVPAAGLPREDVWLDTASGALAACAGGLVPDAGADAEGVVVWTLPARAGGHLDPGAGDALVVVVAGEAMADVPLHGLGFNSADLNGDGAVDLLDVGVFAGDLNGPYAYRSDFRWDGVVNLLDVPRLAAALGGACP